MADEPEPRDSAAVPAPEPPPPTPEPAIEAKPPKPTWQEVELGQTRRQLEQMREENRRLQDLAQAQAATQPAPATSAPPPPPASQPLSPQQPEFRRAVNEEVAQRIRDEKAAE